MFVLSNTIRSGDDMSRGVRRAVGQLLQVLAANSGSGRHAPPLAARRRTEADLPSGRVLTDAGSAQASPGIDRDRRPVIADTRPEIHG